MINHTPTTNSANRENILDGAKEQVLSKNDKNRRIFNTSQKLFEAGAEIVSVSKEMSAILLDMGNNLLKEIDLKEDKMADSDVQSIIDDILKLKGSLDEQ